MGEDTIEVAVAMAGATSVRARLWRGQWSVLVSDGRGLEAQGLSDECFLTAFSDALMALESAREHERSGA